MSKTNNIPAFPQDPNISLAESDAGMTLRDYFAAKALSGMLAYSHVNPSSGNYHENCTPLGAAKSAYDYADAMLEARKS